MTETKLPCYWASDTGLGNLVNYTNCTGQKIGKIYMIYDAKITQRAEHFSCLIGSEHAPWNHTPKNNCTMHQYSYPR